MEFIDLYAGIGGFRYALEDLGHKCVFSAEVDKSACETYYKNFPSHNPYFDMNSLEKMTNEEIDKIIPDHDILTAGFPCQPFSIGGIRKGFEDSRGMQFFNILKILKVKKPKYILLENVKNIINHDNGNTYKVIYNELKAIGYQIPKEPLVISPNDLGLIQRRQRAFFFASKNDKPINIQKPKIQVYEKMEDVYNYGSLESKEYILKEENKYILAWEDFLKNCKNKPPIIWVDQMISNEYDENWQEWKKKYIIKMRKFYKENKKWIDLWIKRHKILEWTNVKFRRLEWLSQDLELTLKNKIITIRQSGIRVSKPNIFPTLVASIQTPIVYDKVHKHFRWMTLNEMRKLQSFPSKFVPSENKQKAYKMFGNAVNVNVIKYIASKILIKDKNV